LLSAMNQKYNELKDLQNENRNFRSDTKN
jgi:hypothetical protein